MPDSAGRLTSADGTGIAFDRYGEGPAVVLVTGAFMDRRHPVMTGVANALAPWFSVYLYDRRGRGDSGDTAPYAVGREIEDLAAVIEAAGGSAMVFGGSSGAALVLEAAAVTPGIAKLAVWEPPYHVDDSAPELPADFARRLGELAAAGRRGDVVERFMVEAAEVPVAAVTAMRADPSWPFLEAAAQTLVYEAAVLGPGNALPADRLAAIVRPVLVLNGDLSPAWMTNAGAAVAAAVPGAVRRVLEGQAHNVSPEALVPELLEFFVAGREALYNAKITNLSIARFSGEHCGRGHRHACFPPGPGRQDPPADRRRHVVPAAAAGDRARPSRDERRAHRRTR